MKVNEKYLVLVRFEATKIEYKMLKPETPYILEVLTGRPLAIERSICEQLRIQHAHGQNPMRR